MKIRYYGHNGSGSGYGRAADEMVEALASAGAELEVRPLAPPASWNGAAAVSRFFKTDDHLTPPDRIIVHTLPLDIGRAIGAMPSDVLTVAYTTWEALQVPKPAMRSIADADALWVPSKATLRAFARLPVITPVPVFLMPHAYDESRDYAYTGERPDRPFTFYYVGAWTARKNPGGLVRAFCSEFTRSDDVQLLLQCRGVGREILAGALAATGLPQEETPRVQISNKELTETELWGLHGAMGDVFVSATRGEAWNLPAFEAMLAGRHIIVPAQQGTADFLDHTTAAQIASSPAPAFVDIRVAPPAADAPPGTLNLQRVGAQGLTARCQWKEPDLNELATRMRYAYEERHRALTVHYDVAAEFGRKAVGQRAIALLEGMKAP